MSKFTKQIIKHSNFYITRFITNHKKPSILFIHGGPGYNCGVLEYLIEYEQLFDSIDFNIILYDQRNCGRSIINSDVVLHKHNITDLHEIILHISNECGLDICSLIGHSYGAKLLYDYCKKYGSRCPTVYLSTADSIVTPRLNNLALDLMYLKQNYADTYQETYNKVASLKLDKIWEISEQLAPFFQQNRDRVYFYWANLDCLKKVNSIQKKINLPPNNDVFMSVRKDLYSDKSNFSVAIDELDMPKLWIVGFHDYIMNGSNGLLSSNSSIKTFYHSSHYPHIEENNHFSGLLNDFIKNA